MTFSAAGSAPDNPRLPRPTVGPVPIEPDDAMAATPHHGPPHSSVSRRLDPDALRRTAHLDRARRSRLAVPRGASVRQAEPQDARGAEWDRADNVVQQLFAVGLAMHTTRRLCGDRPDVAARISEHMNDLQLIVGQIRSTMLDPPTADPGPPAG